MWCVQFDPLFIHCCYARERGTLGTHAACSHMYVYRYIRSKPRCCVFWFKASFPPFQLSIWVAYSSRGQTINDLRRVLFTSRGHHTLPRKMLRFLRSTNPGNSFLVRPIITHDSEFVVGPSDYYAITWYTRVVRTSSPTQQMFRNILQLRR